MPTRSIPWPRILAEGFAIVVSILLAFGIQAWWEERQERSAEQEYLSALLDDVTVVMTEAERTILAIEGLSEDARRRIASATEQPGVIPDSVVAASMRSWGVTYRLRAGLDAYDDLVSSGGVTTVRDAHVRRSLARLSSALEFEEVVTWRLVDHMSRLTVPILDAYASGSGNLGPLIAQVEEQGNSWRDVQVLRKQEVLSAAHDVREAIESVLDD